MAATPLEELRARLGNIPSGLAQLEPSEQMHLLAALTHAREAQQADNAAALDKALTHIPVLLRGTVRRIVYG